MSSKKWTYKLPAGAELATMPHGAIVGLPASDTPVEFEVAVSGDEAELGIEFHYPLANLEHRMPLRLGRVTFEVGALSQRLFRVQIPVTTDHEALLAVVRDLREGLEMLLRRTPTSGPRLNYHAAGAGLGVENVGAPPAWLVDAYKSMRDGLSSGSGRAR